MAFIFWIVLLLPAMGLYVLTEAMIAPFSGVLGPVLKLLSDPVFGYWASWVLLVWNVLVLAALLIARRHMKRSRGSGWEWEYIHQVQGWRRLGRRLVHLALTFGLWWESTLIAIFAVFLAFPSFFFGL
ncbi:hypothetical protein D7V91_12250 [bacterium 1xD42-67]|nr:hypothetical protein D7V91_12250 [bacterium 1xD42-67]